MRSLDLDAVQAFVLVADHGSFTRAADALGATQSGVSLRLKRLEDRLGTRLFERTPRVVRLTPQGEAFLPRARRLLEAQDEAIAAVSARPQRLVLGISDHVAGPELPGLLARVAGQGPGLALEVRLDSSLDLLREYDAGSLDAVIVRRDAGRRDGEVLFRDDFGWFASTGWHHRSGEPLPLVTHRERCGVRVAALRALDATGIPWVEVFVGGGGAAVAAAAMAGLGVSPLARRTAPPGTVDIGPRLGLPALAATDVMLHSRLSDARLAGALRGLAAAFRLPVAA
ncbi:LysR family transcriptional regulator [Inquilinus sp. NPDC058860]|uniref:LysR family transcriptional regulator n=1 Tax=Inquilinus sp. NPDC058860 TaxID=3346652 RepID=UPI0036749E25